jgi:hypothetical protein
MSDKPEVFAVGLFASSILFSNVISYPCLARPKPYLTLAEVNWEENEKMFERKFVARTDTKESLQDENETPIKRIDSDYSLGLNRNNSISEALNSIGNIDEDDELRSFFIKCSLVISAGAIAIYAFVRR